MGDRPAGARIHAAVRSAGDDPRRRAAGAGHVDVAGHLGGAARAAAAAADRRPAVSAREAREAAREAARAEARERRAAARTAAAEAKGRDETAPAARAPASASASASEGFSGDEYRVRSGDSLSKIAGRTQRPGVSLDQMLVSLFRANPSAFSGNNMNRLKAGVVLSVPSAEAAQAIPPGEARQTITAQSADFGAYRQRLAASTLGTAPVAEPSRRQGGGRVTASVDDKKQSANPAPTRSS